MTCNREHVHTAACGLPPGTFGKPVFVEMGSCITGGGTGKIDGVEVGECNCDFHRREREEEAEARRWCADCGVRATQEVTILIKGILIPSEGYGEPSRTLALGYCTQHAAAATEKLARARAELGMVRLISVVAVVRGEALSAAVKRYLESARRLRSSAARAPD